MFVISPLKLQHLSPEPLLVGADAGLSVGAFVGLLVGFGVVLATSKGSQGSSEITGQPLLSQDISRAPSLLTPHSSASYQWNVNAALRAPELSKYSNTPACPGPMYLPLATPPDADFLLSTSLPPA